MEINDFTFKTVNAINKKNNWIYTLSQSFTNFVVKKLTQLILILHKITLGQDKIQKKARKSSPSATGAVRPLFLI